MDSVAGSWAAIEGGEIVNIARTTAYLRAGYGPPNLKVEGDCDCPEDQLRILVGCDDAPYSTPEADGAPWVDAAIPESLDFAGLYVTSFEGLESTYTREVTDILTGGVLGRLRAAPRTLTWKGFLFGRTCCSVAYGLRWLTSVLRQSKCGAECGGEKLDLLVCCPPVAGFCISTRYTITASADTFIGGTYTLSFRGDTTSPIAWDADSTAILAALVALPSIGPNVGVDGPFPPDLLHHFRVSFQFGEFACKLITGLTADGTGLTGPDSPYTISSVITEGPEDLCGCGMRSPDGIPADDDAFRTLYNTGLVEGPLVKSQRGASGRCGCSTIMEVEFSIVAGNPHLYRAPVLLADGETFETGLCPDWLVVASPAECPPPEAGVFTPACDQTLTPVATDPNCVTPTLPPVFTVDESCFCDPFAPTSLCVPVPASTYGMNFQGAPVFSVYSGSEALRSTTIRLVENPLAGDCDVVGADPCNFCEFITIRWFPAFSTLTIDGVNRRVTITTPGGDVQSGEQFMVGNYAWPVLECVDYCVCVTVDGFTAAADATFSLSVYPQEF